MKSLLISFVLAGFVLISCSQNEEEVRRQSLDDVYFYLSNYYIVNDTSQIILTSFKNKGKKDYELHYRIKNNDSLWITHYYNEDDLFINFFYRESNKIKKITDSINTERRKTGNHPFTKRWDWVSEISEIK
ncbi:hypothetical protein PG279_08865 [Riemerella anatipestifer]|nr:hypothetical protein [Riemerella anatipestifer]